MGDRSDVATAAQVVKARGACDILNRMTELGRLESFAVGR